MQRLKLRPKHNRLRPSPNDGLLAAYTLNDEPESVALEDTFSACSLGSFSSFDDGTLDLATLHFKQLNRFDPILPDKDFTISNIRPAVILFFNRFIFSNPRISQFYLFDKLDFHCAGVASELCQLGSCDSPRMSENYAMIWPRLSWIRPSPSNTLVLESLNGRETLTSNRCAGTTTTQNLFLSSNVLEAAKHEGRAAGSGSKTNLNALDSFEQIRAFLKHNSEHVKEATQAEAPKNFVGLSKVIKDHINAASHEAFQKAFTTSLNKEPPAQSLDYGSAVCKKPETKLQFPRDADRECWYCLKSAAVLVVQQPIANGRSRKKTVQDPGTILRKCGQCDLCWHDECMAGMNLQPYPCEGTQSSCANFQPLKGQSSIITEQDWYIDCRCVPVNQQLTVNQQGSLGQAAERSGDHAGANVLSTSDSGAGLADAGDMVNIGDFSEDEDDVLDPGVEASSVRTLRPRQVSAVLGPPPLQLDLSPPSQPTEPCIKSRTSKRNESLRESGNPAQKRARGNAKKGRRALLSSLIMY
jgi:hypothetical protein